MITTSDIIAITSSDSDLSVWPQMPGIWAISTSTRMSDEIHKQLTELGLFRRGGSSIRQDDGSYIRSYTYEVA